MSLSSSIQKPEEVYLRYTQGSSDKVYQVQLICEKDILKQTEGWKVNFQYGRYGRALMSSTKTQAPLSYYRAQSIFHKLVNSKISKGYLLVKGKSIQYTSAPTGGPSRPAKVRTDFAPQLLNQVTFEEACALYTAQPNDIYMQTKWDGERRGVVITDKVVASNRVGFETPIQQIVSEACLSLAKDWDDIFEFDSEDMGGRLVIFDILQTGGSDLRSLGFDIRHRYLAPTKMVIRQLGLNKQLKVDLPYQPTTLIEFMEFISDARANNEEGIVIRIGKGPYVPGKPNSGGYCFKLKFIEDATVLVESVHSSKRSIGMRLWDDDKTSYINVGNCTIPSNKTIPQKGAMIDVKYLYAYKGGSIFQPVYKGVRTDLDPNNLTTAQLKYKKED